MKKLISFQYYRNIVMIELSIYIQDYCVGSKMEESVGVIMWF